MVRVPGSSGFQFVLRNHGVQNRLLVSGESIPRACVSLSGRDVEGETMSKVKNTFLFVLGFALVAGFILCVAFRLP